MLWLCGLKLACAFCLSKGAVVELGPEESPSNIKGC